MTTPSEPLNPAETYQQVLRLIRDSRWTEAKRKLDDIEAASPGFRDVAKLQAMVDEVLPISRYGFGMPAHVAQATERRMEQAERQPVATIERPAPVGRRPSPLRWVVPAIGLAVMLILLFVLTR